MASLSHHNVMALPPVAPPLQLVVTPSVMLQQPIKVQSPEQFDGTKGKLETFIIQLQLCFGFLEAQFTSEDSKVLYVASFL